MLETVGVTGSLGGSAAHAAVSAAPASAVKETTVVSSSRVTLSPRITSDPATGVLIAQYLSSTGEKQLQFPSTAVVAYLRSGLTAEGLPIKRDALGLTTEV
ncbi:MAG: hypothetical protein WC612_01145 [Bdellovibrionales bacterium]|jgi:hypothetical protein